MGSGRRPISTTGVAPPFAEPAPPCHIGTTAITRAAANGDVKLFLSCVSDEFRAYREALRHALTHRRVEIKIQEDFKLPGSDTLAMLEDYIESCNVVIHFIGDMAGSAPPATSVDDLLKRRPELATPSPKKA